MEIVYSIEELGVVIGFKIIMVINAEVVMEIFGRVSPSQMRAARRILKCAYLELTENT